MDISKMTRGAKIERYQWRVAYLPKVLDNWKRQTEEPIKYGTFDDWEHAESHGQGITEVMDELIALSADIDPENTKFWQDTRDLVINMRICCFKIARDLEGPIRPKPTPQEEVQAQAERAEAYRTGGANLLEKDSDG